MDGKALFVLSVAALFVLSSCISGLTIDDRQKTGDAKNAYSISSHTYEEKGVKVSYPSISGLRDNEKQTAINDLLEEEAFREMTNYLAGGVIPLDEIRLGIQYQISFKNNKYLCVIYTGLANASSAVRNLFGAIMIDIDAGKRLQLSDMVLIDYDFVEFVKDALYSYVEKNPEWSVMYFDKLDRSNESFLNMLWEVDAGRNMDFYLYFADDYVGLSFATYHVAGNHFEIEVSYDDIRDCLAIALEQ